MKEDYFNINRDLDVNQICILPKCMYCGSRGHFHREWCTELQMKHYRADSKGNYDIKQVMADIKNGVKRIEIDFSAYNPELLKVLSMQEEYYKK